MMFARFLSLSLLLATALAAEWAVKIPDGVDAHAIARELGFEYAGSVGALEGLHLFRRAARSRARVARSAVEAAAEAAEEAAEASAALSSSEGIVWHEEQRRTLRIKKFAVPDDPLVNVSWHLVNTGQFPGFVAGFDTNVAPVWARGFTGKGVVIQLVDDGLEHSHPDLKPNYYAEASYDFNYDKSDPSPDTELLDDHGTACAGCAAAVANNGVCGAGTAPEASIACARLLSTPATTAQTAMALTYKMELVSISTNSWGNTVDGDDSSTVSPVIDEAFATGVAKGRGGKGIIYMFASGNNRDTGNDINDDAQLNSRHIIYIGGHDPSGLLIWYSTGGANIMAVAPTGTATQGDHTGINTVNRQQSISADHGYKPVLPGDCTAEFDGTSAATPIAAGVMALVLQSAPTLGWRDVQSIIVHHSIRTDASHSSWVKNAAGVWWSRDYGFGRVDAVSYVDAAKGFVSVPPEQSVKTAIAQLVSIPQAAVGASQAPATASVTVASLGDDAKVESVEITISCDTDTPNELEIDLKSPRGTTNRLYGARAMGAHPFITAILVQPDNDNVESYNKTSFHEASFIPELDTSVAGTLWWPETDPCDSDEALVAPSIKRFIAVLNASKVTCSAIYRLQQLGAVAVMVTGSRYKETKGNTITIPVFYPTDLLLDVLDNKAEASTVMIAVEFRKSYFTWDNHRIRAVGFWDENPAGEWVVSFIDRLVDSRLPGGCKFSMQLFYTSTVVAPTPPPTPSTPAPSANSKQSPASVLQLSGRLASCLMLLLLLSTSF